jgi:uncharacterized membrane protein
MVLDHARDFFFSSRIDPADLKVTTPLLFFTRWLTHFCAPVFVLLAGLAAFLYGVRRTPAELTRFLLTRGLWLIFLELFVVHFGWFPDPYFRTTLLQVMWALGWSMLVLAGLSRISVAVCLGVGVLLIAGHNLLDPIRSAQLGGWGPLWSFLHESQVYRPLPAHRVIVGYPLIPWCGVMAVGYALGALLHREPQRWPRYFFGIGAAATVLFIGLRLLNRYGDPRPWSVQAEPVFTLLAFLNCRKYPPSLLYLLMTLGPALMLLAAFQRVAQRAVVQPLVTLGRAPLLFYVAHLFLLHYTAMPIAYARFGSAAFDTSKGNFFFSADLPLWTLYVAWLLAVLILYPLCRWFVGVRARHPDKRWLSYL